jgi:16S rRNA (guanine527-N7)-methyltransferase
VRRWFHVKHLQADDAEYARVLLGKLGIELEEKVLRTLLCYLDGLIEMNESFNLTRIVSAEAATRLHLVDSLVALPEIQGAPEGPLLDIGTGGGFPGVALCMAGNRSGVLLDSVGKKARAVSELLLEAGIPSDRIRAEHGRAEGHALANASAYAVVTARAVSELPALVELAAPLLMVGGRLVALKGSPTEEELARGAEVASKVGLKEAAVRSTELPSGEERRSVVVYRRIGRSSVKLPRRPGMAQSSPLA